MVIHRTIVGHVYRSRTSPLSPSYSRVSVTVTKSECRHKSDKAVDSVSLHTDSMWAPNGYASGVHCFPRTGPLEFRWNWNRLQYGRDPRRIGYFGPLFQ